ncbi:MAG: alpha-ribazole phosphatase [Anaerolineaceae bacterium]|nr:MAG: alpha-ribazole phosphatase [Anaerolineaceae bacterium]
MSIRVEPSVHEALVECDQGNAFMKLYLIRHGQTDWNLAQRFQGQSDIPLNEIGRRQANALAGRLSSQPFDVVYSSDLQRALETTNIIAGDRLEIKEDVRLREMNFGDWEGATYNKIKEEYPDALTAWEDDVYKNAPPNGETLEQLAIRAQSVLKDILENWKDKTVLLVAHGGVLQSLICLALNLPPRMYWQFHVSPASLSEISFYPAGAIVNLLNDISHLENNL